MSYIASLLNLSSIFCLIMLFVKTPWLVKAFYPQYTWDIPTHNKTIFLTFDDGPIPIVTPFVLNILQQYNAKATFFCIGDNICKHPEVFEAVKNAGHTIGNHTYNHLRGWETDDKIYIENFLKADELLKTNDFRPPYGRIKRSQIKLLKQTRPDLKIIMWNILSADYDVNLSPQQCLKNVLKHTSAGDMVLFHDSLKAFDRLEYVLPRAMEHWSKEGYSFEAIV